MRKTIALVLVLLFVFLPNAVHAAEKAPVEEHCRAYILVESKTGAVLAESCADDVMPMASLTKMMTLLILFEQIASGDVKLTDTVTISQNAADTTGSKAFIDAGASYSVDQLIRSIIVGSANDSCVAIAEFLSGSEEAFVLKMNERAEALGMTSTTFCNATGLPNDDHVSTARDMATLSCALVHHDMYFDYSTIWIDNFAHPSGRETMLANTNKLIRYGTGVDGIKTGFTNAAGFCLSASSERDGMRLIAVVLGGSTSKGRFDQASQLLEWGFANYEYKEELLPPEEFSLRVNITGGREDYVDVVPEEKFMLLMQKGSGGELIHRVELPQTVAAPIAQNQTLGVWIVEHEGNVVAEIPLSTTSAVEKATFTDCLERILKLWFTSGKTAEEAQNVA